MAAANTITETITLSISGPGITAKSVAGTTQTAQVGSNFTCETQTIATGSWQAIDIGSSIGTLGYLAVRNLDATNYVQISIDNAGTKIVATVKPGKGVYIPAVAGATYYAEANTAAVQIEFLAIEL